METTAIWNLGGQATKKKYGRDHYLKMAKKSVASRKAKKELASK